MTKTEENQNGRRKKWKMTKMEDDQMEDYQNGRQPKLKMAKLEDDQNER